MKLQTILCAVDFSDEQTPAIGYAKLLAQLSGAELIIGHILVARNIYEQLQFPMDEANAYMSAIIRNAEEEMESFIRKHCHGVTVRTIIHEDRRAADGILYLAEEVQADVIVLATHTRGGLDRFFFGSVADAVLRRAICPVLSVRPV